MPLVRRVSLVVALLVGSACASTPTDPESSGGTSGGTGGGTTGGAGGTADLSQYFITPELCKDTQGPDCTRLRLGNSHLTTTTPAVGKLLM